MLMSEINGIEILLKKAEEILTNSNGQISTDKLRSILNDIDSIYSEQHIQTVELKLSQNRLESSRDKYAHYFEYAPTGLITINPIGIIEEINKSACKFFGLNDNLLINKPLSSFVEKSDFSAYYKFLKLFQDNQAHGSCELKLNNIDGSNCKVKFEGNIVPLDFQDTGNILISLTDICSERKKEMSSLQTDNSSINDSSYFLKQVINTLAIPFFFKDKSGNFRSCNKAFEKFVSKPLKSIIEDGIGDVCDSETLEMMSNLDKQILEKVGNIRYETQFRFADGKVRDVALFVTSISDKNGKVAGIAGAMIELGDKTANEEHLMMSNKTTELLFNNISEAAVIINSEGKILKSSKNFEENAKSLFPGKYSNNIFEIISENLKQELQDNLKSVFEINKSVFFDVSESDNLYKVSVLALHNLKGQTTQALILIKEITKNIEKESNLKSFSAGMNNLIANSPEMLLILDSNFEVKSINDSFNDFILAVYSFELKIGDNAFLKIQDDEGFWSNLFTRTSMGEIIRSEFSYFNDREMIYFDIYSHPVYENDVLIGIVVSARDISDLRNALNNLEFTAVWFKDIIDLSPVIKCMTDKKGIITNVNAKWIEETGISDTKAIGKNIKEFIAIDYSKLENFENLLSDGSFINYDAQLICNDGMKISVVADSIVIGDPNGDEYILFILRNVTELNEVIEALKASETEKRQILNALPLQIIYKDLQNNIQWANSKVLEDTNTNLEFVCGKTSEIAFENSTDLCPSVSVSEIIESGGSCSKEITSSNGKSWIVYSSVIVDDEDNPVSLIETRQDVTSIKIAESQLINISDERDILLENIRTHVWYLKDPVTYANLNSSHAAFFGYAKELAAGKSIYDVLPEYDADRFKEINELVFTHKQQLYTEQWHSNLENELRLLAIILTPIVKNDTVEYVVCSAEDITEIHEAREELDKLVFDMQESRETIERNAGEIAVINEKLMESETKLKSMNENKDKFFSIIAHDLRSPLSGLMGLSDLLCRELDRLSKADLANMTKHMYNATVSIYRLLENLLHWSRIQRNAIEFYPKNVYLSATVKNNFELLNNSARQKRIELESDISTELKTYSDLNMLNTILRNLISNSIKFTNYGGTIKVSAAIEKSGNIVATVSDNGIGMDDETLDKLFKIDNTFSTPGTANEKGTGLGLILCKELAEKNAGTIWAESEVNKGTTFFISMPPEQTQVNQDHTIDLD